MADDADRASDVTALELAHSLASTPLPPRGTGRPECDDCGGDVPLARRSMGYSRCVECAIIMERRMGTVR